MVASASAQIEATAGAKIKDPTTGKPAYGKVAAILIAVSAVVLIACCLVGAEDHGAHFENGRAAFENDAGLDIGECNLKTSPCH
jgi:SHS family lactate transporter-like MFS transporter